jgi:CheY-like chemotaxis protein
MSDVLIVDDCIDQVELMQLAIASLGIPRRIVACDSGEEALLAIEQGAVQPALVLLDVNMPGLDGPATAVRLRRLDAMRRVPIVMMSTSDRLQDVQRGLDAGATSYVAKPTGKRTWSDVLGIVIGYWCDTDLSHRTGSPR